MPRSAPFRVRLVQLFCTALLVSLSTADCYYPNGNRAVDDVQCEPGEDSACCGTGSICLDNGLCLSQEQPFGISRGSCTSARFDNGKCTQHCTDTQRDSGVAIVLYNVTESDILYCCNSIVNRPDEEFPACDSGEPFTIESGVFMPGAALLEGYVKASEVNSTSSCTNTTTDSPDTEEEHTQDAGSSNHDVAIGAGVGVPLGVIALVSIAWALYERSQRRKLLQAAPPTITTVGPFPGENKQWGHHELPSDNQAPSELPTPPAER